MNQNTTQGFTPFRQIPTWDATETFQITGAQLQAVQDLFKSYTPFVKAMEAVFIEGLESGKITIRYEDLEGNPLQKEDIDAMFKQYAEMMAQSLNSPPEEVESREVGMANSAHSEMTTEEQE